MADSSEKILLNQIKQGNEKAFSYVFNKYWERLFLSAFTVLKEEEICKDIVQEIFITLWNRICELEISNLQAYLLQATKYQVAKYIRDNKKYQVFQEVSEHLEVKDYSSQPVEYKELSGIINRKINILPDKCREVFCLSRVEGLSNKQISEKLNLSISTVENHINKAIRLLKHELSGYTTFISVAIFHLFKIL